VCGPKLILSHRRGLVDDERRASRVLDQIGHQMRLEGGEDGATIALVGLVQVLDHDVGIDDVDERKPVGVFDQSYRHPRAAQVIAESAGVLLLLVLVDAVHPQPVGERLARQQHSQRVTLAGAARSIPAAVAGSCSVVLPA
jgi:hypothetical protein